MLVLKYFKNSLEISKLRFYMLKTLWNSKAKSPVKYDEYNINITKPNITKLKIINATD